MILFLLFYILVVTYIGTTICEYVMLLFSNVLVICNLFFLFVHCDLSLQSLLQSLTIFVSSRYKWTLAMLMSPLFSGLLALESSFLDSKQLTRYNLHSIPRIVSPCVT